MRECATIQEAGKSYKRVDHRGRIYVVKLTWAVIDRELRPTAVEVSSKGGVDASMLRSLPLASIIDEERPSMAKSTRSTSNARSLAKPTGSGSGRCWPPGWAPGDDPELLEFVATTYRRATTKTKAPRKAVHDELVRRGHDLSRQQVGNSS